MVLVVGHHKDSAFDPSAASLVASYPGAFEVASEEPAAHTGGIMKVRVKTECHKSSILHGQGGVLMVLCDIWHSSGGH